MVLNIDRRSLVVGAGLAWARCCCRPAAPCRPGCSAPPASRIMWPAASRVPDNMLLWTRYVPATGEAPLRLEVELALEPNFAKVVAGGSVRTGAYRDWTAKITVDGLKPGTVYWYRFVAPDGTKSPVGRTKTLPSGPPPASAWPSSRARTCPMAGSTPMATRPRGRPRHVAARRRLHLRIWLGLYP
jgi:alkaline phosphatase D